LASSTTILFDSTRDASFAAPRVWKLPDLWTQRTRPQVCAKPQTVSHSSHNASSSCPFQKNEEDQNPSESLVTDPQILRRRPFSELLEILRGAPKLTGWNTWWVPTRTEIVPYINEDAIECWLGGDTSEDHRDRDAAHSDFWRISPKGLAFLLRGYQEDGAQAQSAGIAPGTILDRTLPIWRVGEGLLHADYLARRLEATTVSFAVRFTGLAGRRLSQWVNPMDGPWAAGVCKEDAVSLATVVAAETVAANLPEVVQHLLSPLYERFDFSRVPLEIVQRELNRLRKRE